MPRLTVNAAARRRRPARWRRSPTTRWSSCWPCHEEIGARGLLAARRGGRRPAVTTTWSSVGTLVEISAAGVTKATTLASLAAELGVGPQDVIAFGDMPNDLPLLEWAGTSYAMANAHPSVIELADHTAPHNDDDGVATVLDRVFGLSVG